MPTLHHYTMTPFTEQINNCMHMVGKPLYIENFPCPLLEIHHETAYHALVNGLLGPFELVPPFGCCKVVQAMFQKLAT